MCGIAGILTFDGGPVAQSHIKAMTDTIAHRGPDDEGHYVEGGVGLGNRRLAILDLSSAGHQPMQTQDGRFTLTYNGQLYNYKELRTELQARGCRFYSHTDTEVVLQAFAAWGPQCLGRFNGMFAFAIWDATERTLFLARDRYGIKPLYYTMLPTACVFASEIKALTASSLYKPSLDKEGLIEYVTFQNFFSHKTLFQGVHMLMPGCYAVIPISGKMTQHQYWDFDFSGSLKISEAEAIEETDRLFRQAVQRQLVSDMPVNAYLSGGIDSGAITMVSRQFLPHMKTFTIGFDLSSASGLELSFDERSKAERISYLAQTEHYEMVLKAGDMQRCMEKYVRHLEEPRVGQSYPNYYAAKLASKFGKVVLSGGGGDELFGGYPWRYFYTDTPIAFEAFIDGYYAKWQRLLPNRQVKELLSPIWKDVQHVWTRDIFADVFKNIRQERLSPEECFNASLYLEAKTFLHGLLVVEDKLNMAHGLEARVPFLDNDLVDFAQKLPMSLKITDSPTQLDENDLLGKAKSVRTGKHVFKKTLSRYLEDDIVYAQKQGFSSPDASWFRGESIEYVKKELCTPLPLFNSSVVNAILEEHVSGAKNSRLAVWSLLYIHALVRSGAFA